VPVDAVLISQNPMAAAVTDQGTTDVVFRFQAGDDVVELGNGELVIRIEVDDGTGGTDECTTGSECPSGVCTGGVCQAPTCSNMVKNGDESDVDCGGSCGANCVTGNTCYVSGDCVSGVCAGGTCQAPTCSDGVQNGDEAGVDCGGSVCPAC
jgi:hypothetical protein